MASISSASTTGGVTHQAPSISSSRPSTSSLAFTSQTLANSIPLSQAGSSQTSSSQVLRNTAKASCDVCHAVFRLTLDGRLYGHGGKTKGSKCPGSNSVPGSLQNPQPPSSGSTVGRPSSTGVSASTRLAPAINAPSVLPNPLERLVDQVVPTMDHIPKGARAECSKCLSTLLGKIKAQPLRPELWLDLFAFAPVVLAKLPRGGKHANVTKVVKSRAAEFKGTASYPSSKAPHSHTRRASKDPDASLATLVSSKLEQGDFRAAVRLICSTDVLADNSPSTIQALKDKHPPAASGHFAVPPPLLRSLLVATTDVAAAIRSFPKGSAGGLDGLKPQHLKDLLCEPSSADLLLSALTEFVNLLLAGTCPDDISPLMFGGNLTALSKKDGGIRPIAVGSVLRRVAAKCAAKSALTQLSGLLAPRQLGVGVRGGAEAAVHAARRFAGRMDVDQVLIKLDFKNAFNTLKREAILDAVHRQAPDIYNLCRLAYGQSSSLNFKGTIILSEQGCQQGDPLGPLLFSLTINSMLQDLKSELVLGYLDDITIGGQLSVVTDDFFNLQSRAADLGLQLNEQKCEVMRVDNLLPLSTAFSSFISVELGQCELLGAPLFAGAKLDSTLDGKVTDLQTAASRFHLLHSHDALLILKNALSAPKVMYLLRCAPCFGNSRLNEFDSILRKSLSGIANCDLDDAAWDQATLQVSEGGMGIRSVATLAPSAFLASAASTHLLQISLLPLGFVTKDPEVDRALTFWSSRGHANIVPQDPDDQHQSCWDRPWVVHKRQQLSSQIGTDPHNMARFLACSDKLSGAWLQACPITACGLRLDDNAIRVAVGIRLGVNLCAPHPCQCGHLIDARGTHGLACRKNVARQTRHALLNDLVHRALIKAGFPSVKEPSGLLRDDGKRPDGCTLIPWSGGKCLTWDVTSPDTLAASHLSSTSVVVGAAAETAARNKVAKYVNLARTHQFVAIAVESLGPCNADGIAFLREVGRRMTLISGDTREISYLLQRVSVINQRCNAAAIAGCFVDQALDTV